MVKGLDTFQKYFADYEEQYVLIGGAACDILFESNEVNFRATREYSHKAEMPAFFSNFISSLKINLRITGFLNTILICCHNCSRSSGISMTLDLPFIPNTSIFKYSSSSKHRLADFVDTPIRIRRLTKE